MPSAPLTTPSSGIDLSVVIISWNTLQMTRECLESLFASLQKTPDLRAEVILVDNASSDGSDDMVAAEFPEVILIRNQDNRGFAAANNQGFDIAQGRQILLLNSDTISHGSVIGDSLRWLDQNPEAGAMGCRVLNTDGTVQRTCSMYPSLINLMLLTSGLWKLSWPRFLGRYQISGWDRDSEREVGVISGCYLLLRRQVLEEVGPLDDSFFFFGEETDWCKRIHDAGWKLVFTPVGEITHHGGGSVKKLNHKRDIMLSEGTVRLHRKHGGLLGGLAAFSIIALFNLSRAGFWSLAALLKRGVKPGAGEQDRTQERARHFRAVVANSRAIWPEMVK